MFTIPLTQDKFATVDEEDYARVSAHSWWAAKDGNTFYAYSKLGMGREASSIPMHRFILQTKLLIDHKDRNGLNCCKKNLRLATFSQNSANVVMPQGVNGSGYRGVIITKYGCWAARISVNYKRLHIGTFADVLDAARAYDQAAKQHHGEFAVLNFPDQ